MAITIGRAGKLVTDNEGFVIGTLDSIELTKDVDLNDKEREQLEWVFKVPTTKKVTDKYLWTGLNVNEIKSYYPIDNEGVVSKVAEYSKLTQVALSLELISEDQLLDKDFDFEFDVETLIGKTFRFKVIPQRNKPHLSDIDIKTIKLISKDNETSAK